MFVRGLSSVIPLVLSKGTDGISNDAVRLSSTSEFIVYIHRLCFCAVKKTIRRDSDLRPTLSPSFLTVSGHTTHRCCALGSIGT